MTSGGFRTTVRAFLAANLPTGWTGIGALGSDASESFLTDWRRTLFEQGMLGITWPIQYGGQGRSKLDQVVLVEEFARAGVPTGPPNDTFGIKMIGNTLLHQPGIEVRPITMLNGQQEFNEVFFTGARATQVVGAVNSGWGVAMTLLGHERGEEAATNPVMFRSEFDRLISLASTAGRWDDPLIRQRIADCHARVEIMRFLGLRILTGYLRDGNLGPEASISKLYWSEHHRIVTASPLTFSVPTR